jgi:integrase
MTGKPATGDYCKTLRQLPVQSIDTPVILSVLRPSWHERAETLGRVRARIASVLDYAKAAGYRQGDNPAAWDVIGKLLPSRSKIDKVEHFEAVDYHAVPAFVAELCKREGMAARALEFLIYTAARTTEVLQATWSEIDVDKALWVIPAERMKADKEHRVPLAPQVLDLLARLPREAGNDFLFLSPQTGKPWSATALRAVMRRMGRAEVPHGLRSSFSDWAHERTGHSNHTIELSLAHSIGAAAEKAYRRGDMIEKRRKLMEQWAKHCTSPPVVQTGKVVPMRGRS